MKQKFLNQECWSTSATHGNQSGAWYAEAVDRAVIRTLEKITTLQGIKKIQRMEVKEKFAMGNARNVL